MELCGLPKARPIVCSDSPAFQRLHSSVRCATESSTYLPCVIHTTFEQKFHIRWCCIDPLRSPALPETDPSPKSTVAAIHAAAVRARLAGDARFQRNSG